MASIFLDQEAHKTLFLGFKTAPEAPEKPQLFVDKKKALH